MADLTDVMYEDIEKAIESSPYKVLKEVKGTWTNMQHVNLACEYELYDRDGNPISLLCEGQWKLSNLLVANDLHYDRRQIYFDVIGPKGRVIERKFFGSEKKGILLALKFLREVTKFESVQSYELFTENQKLKKQIKKMKEGK